MSSFITHRFALTAIATARSLLRKRRRWFRLRLGELECSLASGRGESVKNRQFQTWLSKDGFAQVDVD